MGQQELSETWDSDDQKRDFVRALLDDVEALERLIADGRIESGIRRIGAEQELFLVDSALRPHPGALDVLGAIDDPRFTTELGLFNLEANLSPLEFSGDCLSRLERELREVIACCREAARGQGAEVILSGILPTLRKEDLGDEWMTPRARYRRLSKAMRDLRGGEFRTVIKGLDEFETTHHNVMLEACNTSFQVHFQVSAAEFARIYNVVQAATGPVLAAAVNSPLLLGHRLWQETRVALFQQSCDTRHATQLDRGSQARVNFGNAWVEESVLEIFREDIARFRVLMPSDPGESSLATLERGETPELAALRLHNGTIYRWNRPCYGVSDGVPHLRIENRVLPAGPSVADEVANAAFFFGVVCALSDQHDDIAEALRFDDARANFMAAARNGLKAQMTWIGGRHIGAVALILEELLPAAERALLGRGLDADDVQRYLGLIEARVASGQTGAQWTLDSLAAMDGHGTRDERLQALTAAMLDNQHHGDAVHCWKPAPVEPYSARVRGSYRTIGQIMTTDLFTVRPADSVDLAASVMDWRHVRHVPVENDHGELVGLISHRQLLRMVAKTLRGGAPAPVVSDVMCRDPRTVAPETSLRDAIALMRQDRIGCLPVIDRGRLVGVVTERDFIDVAARLLDRWLDEEPDTPAPSSPAPPEPPPSR